MVKSVFISYSRSNSYIANQLRVDLQRSGIDVWLDNRSIPISAEWLAEIETGIAKQDAFLYLWSPEAQESVYVQHEYQHALERKRPIAYVRLGPNTASMPPEISRKEYFQFNNDYWPLANKILSWLTNGASTLTSLWDLDDERKKAVTCQFAADEMRSGVDRTWQVGSRKFVCVPLFPGAYSAAWYIGDADSSLVLPRDIQVVLKFGGPSGRTVVEVLDFLIPNQLEPNIVMIEGPCTDNKYSIPDDRPHVWRDCVDLAVKAIVQSSRGRHLHVFIDSPAALVFPIASGLREMFPYSIYNLNRAGHGEYRYSKVYTHPPS